jgi:polar amino acid transport system ATP-binding protein
MVASAALHCGLLLGAAAALRIRSRTAAGASSSFAAASAAVPVIDIAPLLRGSGDADNADAAAALDACVAAIRDACRHVGFFYITGHGVDPALVRRLQAESRRFFALPRAQKMRIAMAHSGLHWKGYFPLGDELTGGRPDWKEGLYFGEELPLGHPSVHVPAPPPAGGAAAAASQPPPFPPRRGLPMHGPNQFPCAATGFADGSFDGFGALVTAYMGAMEQLGGAVMEGVALSLGLPRPFFGENFASPPFTPFRIFHYPADPAPTHGADVGARFAGAPRWGVAEHTDYGVLTILQQDSVGGLEVMARTGAWAPAPPVEGSFVVNIGDMLEIWTCGLYQATPHRVRSDAGRDRLSIPFFFDPNFGATVEPLRDHAPVAAHLARCAARGEAPSRLRIPERSAGGIMYGDYITGKVAHCFPELFASSAEEAAAMEDKQKKGVY